MDEPSHWPDLKPNYKGRPDQHYLLCICGRLGVLRSDSDDELLDAFTLHLAKEGASLSQLELTAVRALLSPSAIRRRPDLRVVKSAGGKRDFATGHLSEMALLLIWDVIWPKCAEGTGLNAHQLARSQTKQPRILARRYVALVFCEHIQPTSRQAMAAEIGCDPASLVRAGSELPPYLHRFPELVELVSELTQLTKIQLPATITTPVAGFTRPVHGRAVVVPIDSDRAFRVQAIRDAYQAATKLQAAESKSAPAEQAQALERTLYALASILPGEVVEDAIKHTVAPSRGVHANSIHRDIRLVARLLRTYPVLAERTNMALAIVRDQRIEVTLPDKWQQAITHALRAQ